MIVRCIGSSATPVVATPKSTDDHVLAFATFSNELAEVISRAGPNVQSDIDSLASRYKRSVEVGKEDLKKVITGSMEKVSEYASILSIKTRDSALCAGITKATGKALPSVTVTTAGDPGSDKADNASESPEIETADEAMKRRMLLINSISEIASTLMDDYNLNNVLVMILETLYRGIGFSRVLMVVKDARTRTMQARFGFGEEIDSIIPKFRFALDGSPDILVESANSGREFVVLNTTAPEYLNRIPDWCKQLTAPRAMVLLPIVVNKAVLSLIYADCVTATSRISMEEIKLFATLTKQAALAIQQKSQRR